MKIKKLMYVLMGTILVFSSCSDNELENGGKGPEQPVASSPLVNVYADESCSEASLLAGDILLNSSKTMTLNVPIHTDVVYMRYNKASGGVGTKAIAVSALTRAGDAVGFNYEVSRNAMVNLILPEDAVQPTDETDAGYLFYHNTGVAMFEDGWPTEPKAWYDEDFNDVVFEYDLKVTECQDAEQMAKQGSKEELLLTLDVRAMGGQKPTKLGVILEGLESKYVDRITASLVLKGGQGTMTDLKKIQLSEEQKVVVDVPNWKWDKDAESVVRHAKLTVDKEQPEGTVITLDGLRSLVDEGREGDFFQVTKGKVNEGLPMLRAEIRLIGKEGLTGADRENQLKAFRNLILDTKRQNFFITAKDESQGATGDKEIHMKGYKPSSAFKERYETLAGQGAQYYTNANGYTWGVKLPVGTKHVYEGEAFAEAYTEFTKWIEANGANYKTWYQKPDAEKTVRYW